MRGTLPLTFPVLADPSYLLHSQLTFKRGTSGQESLELGSRLRGIERGKGIKESKGGKETFPVVPPPHRKFTGLQTATLKPGSWEKASRIKEFWLDEVKWTWEEVGASASLQDHHQGSLPPDIHVPCSLLPHRIRHDPGDKHSVAEMTVCHI